jgi:endonuclease YncB( thermonuclease family)
MDYNKLISDISAAFDTIERSVDNIDRRADAIRAAWEAGRMAHQYKQETGAVTPAIAGDCGVPAKTLDKYIRLYRLYPQGIAVEISGKPLILSHYMALAYNTSLEERTFYLTRAAEEEWSSHELRRRIRGNFYETNLDTLAAATEDAAARTAKKTLKEIPQRLYTYSARVVRVVDGDTLLLEIDVGFRMRSEQKVRLRGINCAESGTLKGDATAGFVAQQLYAKSPDNGAPAVAVRTYKSEKYGRYLVDLWYLPGESDREQILQNGRWLNQELLDNNLAVKVE